MRTYHNSKPKMSRVREEGPCHGYWSFSEAFPQKAPPRMKREDTKANAIDEKREKGGGLVDWMELLGLSGFEDFEQVELNELRELERRNRGRVLRAGRRTIAAVLATAMLLPAALNMTTTVARAAEEKRYPPQATRQIDGRSADDPQIEIESNLVHDKYGFLTSTLELGIRVKSPVIPVVDTQGNPILDSNNEPTYTYRAVQAISLNLAYNTQALHPVSWEWTRGDAATATYDVTTSVDSYYDLKLKTQKDSRIQTAAANSGIVAAPTTAGYQLDSQAVMDGK